MKKLGCAVALATIALASSAFAQSSPGWTDGQVPTPAQWNAAFAAKQDLLSFTPLNPAGGSMTGELFLAASASGFAGLNLGIGSAPSSPVNGDLWLTSAGLFFRLAGSTIGPLSTTQYPIALVGATTSAQAQNTTQFLGVNGGQSSANATAFMTPYTGQINQVVVNAVSAPAAGQTYTMTAFDNATNLGSCTIVAAAFSCTITLSHAVTQGDPLYLTSAFSATSGSSFLRYTLNLTY